MRCEEQFCLNLEEPWCEGYKCNSNLIYGNDAFSSKVLAYETISFEEDDEALSNVSLIIG